MAFIIAIEIWFWIFADYSYYNTKMGKVHGSLARAGKVKNQTPKVEAQEKKKLATGRAKKRIQYNRRFVNVVTAPGGKRLGPNAQQMKQ